jgi:hypothetical protein
MYVLKSLRRKKKAMKYSPADNRVRLCVSANVWETDSTLKRWLICQTKKISLQKSAVLRNAAVLRILNRDVHNFITAWMINPLAMELNT